MSFRVITPVELTDAMLVSCSIAEPDTGEVAWNSGTTYALGDIRYVASNHTMYESLIANNLNNDPTLEVQGDADNPPTKWLAVGKTNRWNALDLNRNSQSSRASTLQYVIAPGARCDSLFLGGVLADSVAISVVSNSVEIYTYTENLRYREVLGWYDYWLQPFIYKPSVALFDLPPIIDAEITITLTSSGTVLLGSLVVGMQTIIGDVQYGAKSDVLNFSKIDRAFDGTAQLLQRRSIPNNVHTIFAEKARVNKIRNLRTELNAKPAVYAGIDQTDDAYFEALLNLGVYKRFTIDLDYPEHVLIELEVEEI